VGTSCCLSSRPCAPRGGLFPSRPCAPRGGVWPDAPASDPLGKRKGPRSGRETRPHAERRDEKGMERGDELLPFFSPLRSAWGRLAGRSGVRSSGKRKGPRSGRETRPHAERRDEKGMERRDELLPFFSPLRSAWGPFPFSPLRSAWGRVAGRSGVQSSGKREGPRSGRETRPHAERRDEKGMERRDELLPFFSPLRSAWGPFPFSPLRSAWGRVAGRSGVRSSGKEGGAAERPGDPSPRRA